MHQRWKSTAATSSSIFIWKIPFTLATVARGANRRTPVSTLIVKAERDPARGGPRHLDRRPFAKEHAEQVQVGDQRSARVSVNPTRCTALSAPVSISESRTVDGHARPSSQTKKAAIGARYFFGGAAPLPA